MLHNCVCLRYGKLMLDISGRLLIEHCCLYSIFAERGKLN